MKKSKKLIPLLLALAVIFSLLSVAHADEGNVVEVKSGSQEAKVTFTIEDVLAFEGTVTTKKSVGFNVKSIESKIAEEKKDDTNWVTRTNEATDQIVIVGGSIPATITITVTLKSDSPMKDGAYAVTLTYGRTNSHGSYNAGRRLTAMIYVGIAPPSEEESDSKSTLSDTPSTSKPATSVTPVTPETETSEEVVTVPENDGENSRVEVIGALDTMMLRSMLEEAEKLKTHGELNREQLEKLQAAIDAGEEAMLGDRQADIDDAAATLYEVIEELGGPISDEIEDEPEKEKSGGLLVPLIIAVVAVLGIAGILMYLYMKKKMQVKYEGAPIVDYEIGDDDLL